MTAKVVAAQQAGTSRKLRCFRFLLQLFIYTSNSSFNRPPSSMLFRLKSSSPAPASTEWPPRRATTDQTAASRCRRPLFHTGDVPFLAGRRHTTCFLVDLCSFLLGDRADHAICGSVYPARRQRPPDGRDDDARRNSSAFAKSVVNAMQTDG
uniref:Secreted protein n=1 Tax=Steinernema glaseri TaxID=37863 RepID=A0A1I8AQD3_9BILA